MEHEKHREESIRRDAGCFHGSHHVRKSKLLGHVVQERFEYCLANARRFDVHPRGKKNLLAYHVPRRCSSISGKFTDEERRFER